jgi:RRXRR protein
LSARQKTNQGMPPQFLALESRSVDKPSGGYETGPRRRNTVSGWQHGREEATQSGLRHPRKGSRGVQRVFVLDRRGNPLMPCQPARARELLRKARAKVVRHVLFRLEVEHRSQSIHQKLQQRADYRRRRRSANLRHRAPRFNNRTKPASRLAPSLRSRVQHLTTWATRLQRWAPVTVLDVETVRFDTHLLTNPDVTGIGYQHGPLAGFEVREYLLFKFGHKCVYCDATDRPLNIDHLLARPNGKHAGVHTGRVAVRTTGTFRVGSRDGINHHRFTLLQHADGYHYTTTKDLPMPIKTNQLLTGVNADVPLTQD